MDIKGPAGSLRRRLRNRTWGGVGIHAFFMDYLQEGWHGAQIAALFRLLPDEIQAAIAYIEDHQEDVLTTYQHILARHRHPQYPPEVQAKRARSREKLQARLAATHA